MMKSSEFRKLKTFGYEDDITGLDVGDCFLMGEHMVDQIFDLNQNESRAISYYRVISKKYKNISYVVEIKKLED